LSAILSLEIFIPLCNIKGQLACSGTIHVFGIYHHPQFPACAVLSSYLCSVIPSLLSSTKVLLFKAFLIIKVLFLNRLNNCLFFKFPVVIRNNFIGFPRVICEWQKVKIFGYNNKVFTISKFGNFHVGSFIPFWELIDMDGFQSKLVQYFTKLSWKLGIHKQLHTEILVYLAYFVTFVA